MSHTKVLEKKSEKGRSFFGCLVHYLSLCDVLPLFLSIEFKK